MQLFTSFVYFITLLLLFPDEHLMNFLPKKNTTEEIELTELNNATSTTKHAEIEIEREDNKTVNHNIFDYLEKEITIKSIILFKCIKDIKRKAHKKHKRRHNKRSANKFGDDKFEINPHNSDENKYENQNIQQDKFIQIIEEFVIDFTIFYLQDLKQKIKETNKD